MPLTAKPMISLIIPSYNDQPIIMPHYQALKAVLDGQDTYEYELIYVDDGSTDGSQQRLDNLAQSDDRVHVIELYRNFGQQRALFAGLNHSRGDYVVTLDGDFQYPPEVVLQVTEALHRGADLVSGVRQGRADPLPSRIASAIGNRIIRKILKVSLQDFGSVKGFSRDLVNRILGMRHYYSDVYPAALSLRPAIVEIPVEHRRRPHGRSHWNVWMRFKLYLDMYVSYSDDQFTAVFRTGILLILMALAGMVFMLLWKLTLGHQATLAQIVTGAYLVGFTGAAMVGWTLLMTFVTRIYKQNVLNEPFAIRRLIQHGVEERESEHRSRGNVTVLPATHVRDAGT